MVNRIQTAKVVALTLAVLAATPIARAGALATPAEVAQYTRYTQNEQIAEFLSVLDHISPELSVRIIGRSLATGTYPSRDLFLCILTSEGIDSPSKLNREKPSLLLFASQHGDEQSAKEAALQLIRDLAVGDLNHLLRRVNFLVIPQVNPYGNWVDRRRNEQDLDLNRDHVKLEAPETEAVHRVFREWMPEITMDAHEKGDDFYRVSIGCVSNLNIHPQLQRFSRDTLLPKIAAGLEGRSIPFHEYLVTQPMGVDTSAGASYRSEETEQQDTLKRYSTTDLNDGRNSLGIYETLSFILEGASRADLATLRERTYWQHSAMSLFAETVGEHAEEINRLVRGLRQDLLARSRIYSEDDPVHLRMEYVRKAEEPNLTIREYTGAESEISGVLTVDKKAGEVLRREDVVPYPHPADYSVQETVVENWFPVVQSTVTVARPLGYVVPSKHLDVVETMLRHDLEIHVLTQDARVDVEAYEVADVKPAEHDYLAPETIEVTRIALQAQLHRGDFFVPTSQAGANLIPVLLEPQSQYGFIRYRKFGLVPNQGEVFPFLRMIEDPELPLVPYRQWEK